MSKFTERSKVIVNRVRQGTNNVTRKIRENHPIQLGLMKTYRYLRENGFNRGTAITTTWAINVSLHAGAFSPILFGNYSGKQKAIIGTLIGAHMVGTGVNAIRQHRKHWKR